MQGAKGNSTLMHSLYAMVVNAINMCPLNDDSNY